MHLNTKVLILTVFPGLLFWSATAATAASGTAPPRAKAAHTSFLYDVHPILSKAGCNQGTCHGNANGKGGLKLSLRGADPAQDYYSLVAEALGRRVNRAAPARSLMLRKPTAALPHSGGQRFRVGSREYTILMRWLQEGALSDVDTAPKLVRLEVTPAERVVVAPATRQPLTVRAHFADGSSRDVTREAVYEPSDTTLSVSPEGVVEAPPTGGETGILVRWASRMEAAHLTFVPARAEADFSSFTERNLVDEAVHAKLRTVRISPSPPADDATFIRRAYLDALGILPTATETLEFFRDRRPDKRDRLVDALLERPEFDDFWAMKWADLLRAEERSLDPEGMKDFYTWLRGVVHNRMRLDQFVRELLTATGSTYYNPAANYYRRSREPEELAEVTAQLFMGVRLRCAKCHNHPYDVWKQDEYYSMASFFARVTREDKSKPRRQRYDAHEWNGEEFIEVAQSGEVQNPRTGEEMTPSMLGRPLVDTKASEQGDRRVALATWLTQPSNPFFAPAMVNRIWYHVMGRGIVEPVDDFRPSNPPSNAPLLEALTRDFVANGYDLRHTVGLIMKSSTYQLSEVPDGVNATDERYFSHSLARRLTAEQLLNAVSQATDVPEEFEGYPPGTRVTQVVPTWQVNPFLRLFGQPPRETVCECERTNETTLGQSFELISGRRIDTKLRDPDGRVAKLVAAHKANGEIVTEIYLSALNRYPTIQELNTASRYVTGKPDQRRALEDILWATLNTKEFLMRR
jgi:Protein of unknown function (DUF1549)/Protein of unknown function (DUF1553)